MISIILSIAVWWFLNDDQSEQRAHAERFGIFIGLWAPTLLILSNRFDRFADKAAYTPGYYAEAHRDNSGIDEVKNEES